MIQLINAAVKHFPLNMDNETVL